MRGPGYAKQFLQNLDLFVPTVETTLLAQLRVETHMVDDSDEVAELCRCHKIPYVVFNDHVPHKSLASGKKPPSLTGQALKSGRSPKHHLSYLKRLHAASETVQQRLPKLIQDIGANVILGSHDDPNAEGRKEWNSLGVASRSSRKRLRPQHRHIMMQASSSWVHQIFFVVGCTRIISAHFH